ncbi:MAG: tetratricopeptide repeat protein [Candidatus Obscuribacterales bacterium]|jgi:tetratricopeptide (TPR) repeat protein|nr:tetratricopeptide repeat protein [Candidatus Obscuribacterales bacterium]
MNNQLFLAMALLTWQLQYQFFLSSAANTTASNLSQTATKSTTTKMVENKKAEPWLIEFEAGLKLTDKQEYADAVPHFRKSLELLPSKSPIDKAGINQELGMALYQLREYDEAMNLFIESTAAYQKEPEKNKDELALGYEMLSRTCRHTGRPADAEKFGLLALYLSATHHGKNSIQYAYNLRNMAKLYMALFRYLDAEDVLKKAIPIMEADKDMDQEQLAVCLEFLWESLDEQEKTNEADKILKQINLLEKKIGKIIHYARKDNDATRKQEIDLYMRALRYSVKKNWDPPKSSEDCRAIVFFKIHVDGTISELKTECPSGDQAFDQCCLKSVKDAFARPLFLPKSAPQEGINISYTFEKTVTSGSAVSSNDGNKRIDPVAVALKLIKKHNYKEAKAILSMPDLANSLKANLALCEIETKLKRPAEAEKYARKVLSIDPNNIDAHIACADALVRQLKFPEAIKHYAIIVQSASEPEAREHASKRYLLLRRDMEDGGSTLRAHLLLSDRKADEALKMLEQLKNKYPKNSLIEYYMSDAFLQLSQPAKALPHIKQAIVLDPDDIDLWIRESWVEQALGHGKNSSNILREIIKRFPNHSSTAYVKDLLKHQDLQGGITTIKNDTGTDYLSEFSQTPLKRWNLKKGQPLKVCIVSGDYVPGYRDELKQFMIDAINTWTTASNGKISCKFTDDFDSADIVCMFRNQADDGATAAEAGCTYKKGGAAYLSSARICIETEVAGSVLSDDDYKITCLHEFGHALGLGHSKSDKDIMYFAAAARSAALTDRDKNTLARLYSDEIKFPDWALLDEEGLALLEQYKPREAMAIFEQALKKAPKNELIEDHLARSYALAVYQNLSNREISDSNELLQKANALPIDESLKKRLSDLQDTIKTINNMSDSDRKQALDAIVDKLKWPVIAESAH